MKLLVSVILCVSLIVYTEAQNPSGDSKDSKEKYSSKFDDFDLDSVLNNRRVLSNYVKCLVGEGSCTNEGRELKKVMPEAIKTECSKCDEKQKAASVKVLKVLDEKHPELLKKLLDKYDPQRLYEKRIRERIARVENETTKSSVKAAA